MAEATFSLGMTYWPRRSAYQAWNNFDRGAVREELAQVASFGCDTVRLCLRWEEFQPRPGRVGSPALRALEQALDAAQEAGLRVVAALFAGAMAGVLQLPAWATGTNLLDDDLLLAARYGPQLLPLEPEVPVLYGDMYHNTSVRDLYRDRGQLEAQRYLVREVVGYFGQHSAAWAWQLGFEWERARLPRSPDDGYEWLSALTDHAREHGARRLLGVLSPRTLSKPEALRPEMLAELADDLAVHAYPTDPLRLSDPASPAAVAFLHALSVRLAGVPMLVASIGLPTAPDNQRQWVADRAFGRIVRGYLADEDQQAAYLEATLLGLYRAGATGGWLASYADASEELWKRPPFDHSRRERTLGIVRADGREKPAADALRSFSTRLRTGALGAPGQPERLVFDSEQYWRNPAGEIARLLREWERDTSQ